MPHRIRVATGPLRIVPTFLVIGAQRAGTTSLFDYLLRHPDVRGPLAGGDQVWWTGKELHFFDERFWRGLNWYRSFFPTVFSRNARRRTGKDLVVGEATPFYMFHPLVPERVAASIPEVRLVALLRDPVERAWSHYKIMRRSRREKLSFGEALEAEPDRLAKERERLLTDPKFRSLHYRHHAYFARGLYAEQLERWLDHFPREQLLVLRAEELHERPADVYRTVLEFLDLRPHELKHFGRRNRSALRHGKPAQNPDLDPSIRDLLAERFADPNARLAELLGENFGWTSSRLAERRA
jgi:hypothetical protein